MPQVKVPFEVTGWEPEPLELGEPGAVTFGRVGLRKTFSGPLIGTSVVAMTSAAVGEAPAGQASLQGPAPSMRGVGGREVLLQHTGVVDEGAPPPSGVVLPGTGTGELTGLRGTMTIAHGESGAVLHLDYELP
jgi:hypothetical protein